MEQRLRSEEQMRRKIEQDIRSLRSEIGLSAKPTEIPEPMTVVDISQAVKEVQAAYRQALDQTPSAPPPPPSPSAVASAPSEPPVAASRDIAQSTATAEVQTPQAWQGSSRPPTESQRERLKKEATAAANRAHTERTANDLHVDDGERAARAAERGGMAERMRRQAEETKRRMQELKKASWAAELAERQQAEQGNQASADLVTAAGQDKEGAASTLSEATHSPSPAVVDPNLTADPALMKELEREVEPHVDLPGASSVEASASKKSPKPRSLGGKPAAPRSAESTTDKDASEVSSASRSRASTKSAAADEPPSSGRPRSSAVHGIDESGDWSFTIARPPTTDGWHDVPIILRRSRASHRLLRGLFHSQVSSSTSETAYSTTARVFFYPHADMVELDGAVWRCGQEGKRYVVRERISGPGGPL